METGWQMSACFFLKKCFTAQRAEAENSVLPGGVEMCIVFFFDLLE